MENRTIEKSNNVRAYQLNLKINKFQNKIHVIY